MLAKQASNATPSASSAVDQSSFATVLENRLYSMRFSRNHNRYYLHLFNGVSVVLDVDQANVIYDCVKRHILRVVRKTCSFRESVYTLRSDIRAVIRTSNLQSVQAI